MREGLPKLLDWIKEQGFHNFVTTSGSFAYAQEVLERTQINRYFDAIYDGNQVDVGFGKRYGLIKERMELSTEDALARMLVVGDSSTDQPVDMGNTGIVFIHQPGGYQRSVESLIKTIEALLCFGEGSFFRGFQRLFSDFRDKNSQCFLPELLQICRPYLLYRKVDNTNVSLNTPFKSKIPTVLLLP